MLTTLISGQMENLRVGIGRMNKEVDAICSHTLAQDDARNVMLLHKRDVP